MTGLLGHVLQVGYSAVHTSIAGVHTFTAKSFCLAVVVVESKMPTRFYRWLAQRDISCLALSHVHPL